MRSTQSATPSALLESGARTIERSRTLVLQARAIAHVWRLDAHHRMPCHPRDAEVIIDAILDRALCEECLLRRTRLSRARVLVVVAALARQFTVVRPGGTCGVCFGAAPVFRLG
jgi:hypothetical protein